MATSKPPLAPTTTIMTRGKPFNIRKAQPSVYNPLNPANPINPMSPSNPTALPVNSSGPVVTIHSAGSFSTKPR
jgi:hypothetical protein